MLFDLNTIEHLIDYFSPDSLSDQCLIAFLMEPIQRHKVKVNFLFREENFENFFFSDQKWDTKDKTRRKTCSNQKLPKEISKSS